MNVQNEEKKMLIESMKKLVSHVSSNPLRQNEIFQALSLQDLNKILLNLKDDNQYLRRISALLLCELFYQNAKTKMGAIKLLSIHPNNGRICLSGIPESIAKYPSTLKKCLELMQTPLMPEEEDKICWIINLERKSLKLETLDYKKYSSFTFIDPQRNLFGFTIGGKRENETVGQSQRPKEIEKKREFQYMVDSARTRTKPESPSNAVTVGSDFYKNYLESKNKPKEPMRSSMNNNYLNMSVDAAQPLDKRGSYTRPITSRINPSPYLSKRDELNTSLEAPRPTTIQTVTNNYGRMSFGVGKMNNSYHDYSGKMNESYTNNYPVDQSLRQRQIKTDRKIGIQVKDQRMSIGGSKEVMNDHEKFYNRVKQILRK